MTLDIGYLKRQQAELKAHSANRDNSWIKPKAGVNKFRLFPFVNAITGKEELKRDIKRHEMRGSKPKMCGRSPNRHGISKPECEGCEEAALVKKRDGDQAARELWAKFRGVFNVVPLVIGDKEVPANEQVIRLWYAPPSVVEGVIDLLIATELPPDKLVGPNGRDVRVKFDPNASPAKMYQCILTDASLCKALPAELRDQVKDLYTIPSLEPGWYQTELTGLEAEGTSSDADEGAADDTPAAEPAPKTEPAKEEPKAAPKPEAPEYGEKDLPALQARLTPPWEAHFDGENSQVFFWNPESDESVWIDEPKAQELLRPVEKPAGPRSRAPRPRTKAPTTTADEPAMSDAPPAPAALPEKPPRPEGAPSCFASSRNDGARFLNPTDGLCKNCVAFKPCKAYWDAVAV